MSQAERSGAAGQVAVLDVVVQPLAYRLDPGPAVLDLAELLPREIDQLVRVAVPARQRVAQQRRAGRSPGECAAASAEVVVVRLGRHGDNRVVPEEVASLGKGHPVAVVPVAVGELLGRQLVAERQRLGDHVVPAVRPGPHVEEQRGRPGHLVGQAAAHAHGEVELRRDVFRDHDAPIVHPCGPPRKLFPGHARQMPEDLQLFPGSF